MNKSKDIEYQVSKDGIGEVYVHAISSWNGFDEILDYLLKVYSVEIISNEEKYFHRVALLKVNGYQLIFSHDDLFGNVLTGHDISSVSFLKELSYKMRIDLK